MVILEASHADCGAPGMSGIRMDDGCVHMNGVGFPDRGLWLAA